MLLKVLTNSINRFPNFSPILSTKAAQSDLQRGEEKCGGLGDVLLIHVIYFNWKKKRKKEKYMKTELELDKKNDQMCKNGLNMD